MSSADYEEARKSGKKEYKYCLSIGRTPYLPVLEDILSNADILTEQKRVGVQNIPLEFVVGTATTGRTTAFAANFMPILDEDSEFAMKWGVLADAQVNEGIRDPIICYEYMNRYYVVEGNKRVSVLKYFNAVSIPAIVTRKVPRPSEEEDVRLYYEYMHFEEVTGLNTIEFNVLGNADILIDMIGAKTDWDPMAKEGFARVLFLFTRVFNANHGQKLDLKLGDALVAFLRVYGYEAALAMNEADFSAAIKKAWNEIAIVVERKQVDLIMDPQEVKERRKNVFNIFLPSSEKQCTVAFLYPKSPEESDWIYGHELGRNYLEETFPGKINTISVENVSNDNIVEVLEDVIEKGASIIFEVAPQVMEKSLQVAVNHPEVTILNCSLNASHKYIRTYYARMYEAKFLAGMIAGIMAENDKIAYIADYPIFGMIANINAFAYGVQCVNPRAKIYLEWSTKKDYDLSKIIEENNIHIVSDQDMITPQDPSRAFGLYAYDEEWIRKNLVMPIWNWGIFYEKLIQSILSGVFASEEWDERRPLNYWWGMSAGAIDMVTSNNVPAAVRCMIDRTRDGIRQGFVQPFTGVIKDQEGNVRNQENQDMTPEEIMKMDWLLENIIGSIPEREELIEGAQTVVESKGV